MRALLLLGLLLTACAPPLMLEGAACPCTTGWTCCENVSICVREGTSCPTVPGPDVTPAKVELGQDRIQRFTTTATDVTWAIEEGAAGGTIDQTGRYRAPNVVGEYHMLATAHGGTTRVTITVRPLRLSVLAGTSGGASRLPVDGVGPLARLSEPKGLALVGRQLFFRDQNQLRRLDLATRRVDTLIGSTERRVPNTPGSFGYQRFTELSVSRAGTLLFHDETCTREYSVARDTLDTFWCNEPVSAMAGDETRLIRLGGTPSKLLVIDRATRQSVELPAPAEGFVGVVKLSLREDLLWLLDHSGTALRVWDLRQPTAPPRVVIAPSLGKVFVDLEADFTDYAPHGTSVTLLEAGGRLASWNIDGDSLGFRTAAGNQVLGFTVTGPEPIHGYYLLTPDTLRVSYSWTDELLAGKPARDRIEVDGIGGGAGLVVGDFGFATRGDVTWLGSPLSVRRIARDGTTTSIPTDLPADSITVDDHHLWLFNANALALRRIALSPGSTWQTVAYQPDERIALLGPLADGRIAFVERRKVRFLDPSTGELLPTAIPLPHMAIVSLDPSGALYGEVISLQSRTSQTPPMSTGLNGVQRLDFSTGQLTKAGPEPLLAQFTNSGIGSWLASATQERQYAVSTAGDQVFIDQNGAWVPLVGVSNQPAVRDGSLPGSVNTIDRVATLDNGDVVLVDKGEHVVLVVE